MGLNNNSDNSNNKCSPPKRSMEFVHIFCKEVGVTEMNAIKIVR